MGNVAAMLQEAGARVTGSDNNVYPPMSDYLAARGIPIASPYSPENLPADPDAWIVVGNALSRGNVELEAALDAKRPTISLPEALKFFFLRKTHNLVVTGTHGKTTTTSLLAWLFEHAGKKPSWLIGGLPENLGTGCKRQDGAHWILEGDEYDTAYFDKRSKFVHYLPELVILNNLEFDHADIFANLEAIQNSFRQLVRLIPQNGALLINADDENIRPVLADARCPIIEIGFGAHAAVRIEDWRAEGNGQSFKLLGQEFHLPLSGKHNARNAAMALTAARHYQIPLETLAAGLAAFRGIRRRQEIRGEKGGVTILDDFGHHPTAIAATLEGLRTRFAGRRLWALFEPRSNTTRRAVFQESLPAALALADGVVVAQVAALEQIPAADRLDPERVVADIARTGIPAYYEANATAIVARLLPLLQPQDVVVVFSNGGFGGLHEKLLAGLSTQDAARV